MSFLRDTPVIAFLLAKVRDIDVVVVLATLFVVMGAYLVLFVTAAGSPLARAVLFKTGLFTKAIAHMALSREKQGWPTRVDPVVAQDGGAETPLATVVSTKRVIFVRHGESTWNEIFNRGFGVRFPVRLFEGVLAELLLLFTKSSFFIDSPLSEHGFEQARDLRRFLARYDGDADSADCSDKSQVSRNDPLVSARRVKDAEALSGVKGTSIIVASNLRRACQTTAIAFWDRLARTGEKIYVLSSLQEIARNVDTRALAGARESPPLHGLESKVENVGATPMGKMVVGDSGSVVGLNTHFNTGNKQIGRKGYAALREFAEFACAQDADFVIAGGHSLWFREFFRMFLDDEHLQTQVACRKKIVNCGVVAFTLTKVKVRPALTKS